MAELPPAVHRVETAAIEAGLRIDLKLMPETTRTAEDAAKAVGCEVGQIVKSLIFKGKTSGKPYLRTNSPRSFAEHRIIDAANGSPCAWQSS